MGTMREGKSKPFHSSQETRLSSTYKELCTKLSWSIGTTFGVKYGFGSKARSWSEGLAREILETYEAP